MQPNLKHYLKQDGCESLIIELKRKVDLWRKEPIDLDQSHSPNLAFKHLAETQGMDTLIEILQEMRQSAFQETPLEHALSQNDTNA